MNTIPNTSDSFTRRDLLSHASAGFAGVALAAMLQREGARAADGAPANAPPGLHHTPRAKRAIHIFLGGGLSQVDSFDYKPQLEKLHGKSIPNADSIDVFNSKVGLLHKPHWPFKQRGESGLWVSDLFPEIAKAADELTLIRSMVAETGNHTPATYQANAGFRLMGFPALGSWLSYGLGAINDDLPTFVVIPDARGLRNNAANFWSNGFLPARHQGVVLRSKGDPINDLRPSQPEDEALRHARYDLLHTLNKRHAAQRGGADALSARIKSYELAARMQTTVPEAADIDAEPEHVKSLYGLDRKECRDFARGCILARRLIERGVRFVQLWSGTGFSWDAHGDVTGGQHAGEAKKIDRPVYGLLADLRARGMLDDTLVIFSSEFGRTPFAQSDKGKLGKGRDHNQTAYTNWLAGAGLKHGISYGATDDVGYAAVDNVATIYDFHATILHLFGIDHERLTFYHNGIQRRLTNVHGHVIRDVLA